MYFDGKNNTGRIMLLNTDSDKENGMDVFWGIWNAIDLENYQKKKNIIKRKFSLEFEIHWDMVIDPF